MIPVLFFFRILSEKFVAVFVKTALYEFRETFWAILFRSWRSQNWQATKEKSLQTGCFSFRNIHYDGK